MNIKLLFIAIRFYSLSAAYLFLVFGSIYGLFVDELSFGLSTFPTFHFSLTGWIKNLFCIFGLFIAGLIPAIPILLALYRAINNKPS